MQEFIFYYFYFTTNLINHFFNNSMAWSYLMINLSTKYPKRLYGSQKCVKIDLKINNNTRLRSNREQRPLGLR